MLSKKGICSFAFNREGYVRQKKKKNLITQCFPAYSLSTDYREYVFKTLSFNIVIKSLNQTVIKPLQIIKNVISSGTIIKM